MFKNSAFWATFGALFLAEMGDKTQLAVITLAANTGTTMRVVQSECRLMNCIPRSAMCRSR